jgi:hypothetical protein
LIPESTLGRDNWWVEGPNIYHRHGYYYLTYTGNHLCSRGYRVGYSVSKEGPVSGYQNMKNKIFHISTRDEFHALGHSSNCIAPDLDGACIGYHNIEFMDSKRPRRTNIDRLFTNGARLYSNIIWWEQAAPILPPVSGRGKDWLTQDGTALTLPANTTDAYTAEFNLQLASEADVTFVYGETGKIVLSGSTATVYENGEVVATGTLPKNYDPLHLTTARIQRGERGQMAFELYYNQEVVTWTTGLAAGKVGIENAPQLTLDYCAYSPYGFGSGDRAADKAIPGVFDAYHATVRPQEIASTENGMEVFCVPMQVGDELKFKVNVWRDGEYLLEMRVKNTAGPVRVSLTEEGYGPIPLCCDEPDVADAEGYRKVVLGSVTLHAGRKTLTVSAQSDLTADTFWLTPAADEIAPTNLVENGVPQPGLSVLEKLGPGAPSMVTNVNGLATRESSGFAYAGEDGWTDYAIHSVISAESLYPGSASILFRLTDYSYFRSQVPYSGFGYQLELTSEGLSLYEWRYERDLIASVPLQYGCVDFAIDVELKGPTITVKVDGETKLTRILPDSFRKGKVALLTAREGYGIRSFRVEPLS